MRPTVHPDPSHGLDQVLHKGEEPKGGSSGLTVPKEALFLEVHICIEAWGVDGPSEPGGRPQQCGSLLLAVHGPVPGVRGTPVTLRSRNHASLGIPFLSFTSASLGRGERSQTEHGHSSSGPLASSAQPVLLHVSRPRVSLRGTRTVFSGGIWWLSLWTYRLLEPVCSARPTLATRFPDAGNTTRIRVR